MLLEHTLLTSGETAESGYVYVGWPARQIDVKSWRDGKIVDDKEEDTPAGARILCSKCLEFPRGATGQCTRFARCYRMLIHALSHRMRTPLLRLVHRARSVFSQGLPGLLHCLVVQGSTEDLPIFRGLIWPPFLFARLDPTIMHHTTSAPEQQRIQHDVEYRTVTL
jgi:hypothetical protein